MLLDIFYIVRYKNIVLCDINIQNVYLILSNITLCAKDMFKDIFSSVFEGLYI